MAEAANLLRHETSPYLLQHADNPVHWRPWGAAALAEAARANSLSCCRSVMRPATGATSWRTSCSRTDTAALMNRLFVNIKVDREERPDIDHLYMSALHALGEQGGWPLTMFLAPDGSPFWGGTYFPPEPRWGRPSFQQVLRGVSEAWHSGNASVQNNMAALRRALERMSVVRSGGFAGTGAPRCGGGGVPADE